jgi:RNA polymerase sigma factor (sigma-70 family)
MIDRTSRDRSLSAGQKNRQIAKWRALYEGWREHIVNQHLGLVYEMLRRSKFQDVDRDELLSEGLIALLRSVESYNPWRGYRFSTYACNCIIRAFLREARRQIRRREQAPVRFDHRAEKNETPVFRRETEVPLLVERLNHILRHNHANLSETEWKVLAKRFPRERDTKRLTFENLGRKLGVSHEGVRQIQNRALSKLRIAIENDVVLVGQLERRKGNPEGLVA